MEHTTVLTQFTAIRHVPEKRRFGIPLLFNNPDPDDETFGLIIPLLCDVGFECVTTTDIEQFLRTFRVPVIMVDYYDGCALGIELILNRRHFFYGYICMYDWSSNDTRREAYRCLSSLVVGAPGMHCCLIERALSLSGIANWLRTNFVSSWAEPEGRP